SQSMWVSTTSRKFPLSSPFVHNLFLLLEKKVTRPSSRVFCQAASFIYPSISTSSVWASCMMAGTSPPLFPKSICSLICLFITARQCHVAAIHFSSPGSISHRSGTPRPPMPHRRLLVETPRQNAHYCPPRPKR